MSQDLMYQDQIRDVVRAAYGAITTGAGLAMARRLYSDSELAIVPGSAVDWALGVGNPVRHAQLSAGEVVLDLGSGGGIDTILAAERVGPEGHVVGLDALPEMCERARAAASAAGVAEWCDYREGEMEAIPLPDESVDVVISNGVINLSPRKSRAFAEIARVLRTGGRVCVSDIVIDDDLPPEILSSGPAWAGCIAGALSEGIFSRKLGRAGLVDVEIGERCTLTLDDVAHYPLFTPEVLSLMRRVLADDARRNIATSVIVRARKPAARMPATVNDGPAVGTLVQRLDEVAAVGSEGVTVRLLKHVDEVDFKVLDIEPGHTTPFHTHPHAHRGIVISGSGTLQLTGQCLSLTPSDVFSVAPNEPHAIVNDGPVAFRLVCMDCLIDAAT
jgi:arsenite methyltransferase